jgi:hypothetical protein
MHGNVELKMCRRRHSKTELKYLKYISSIFIILYQINIHRIKFYSQIDVKIHDFIVQEMTHDVIVQEMTSFNVTCFSRWRCQIIFTLKFLNCIIQRFLLPRLSRHPERKILSKMKIKRIVTLFERTHSYLILSFSNPSVLKVPS